MGRINCFAHLSGKTTHLLPKTARLLNGVAACENSFHVTGFMQGVYFSTKIFFKFFFSPFNIPESE
jgi:arginine/lysine/ornithine decarboxylase